MLSRFLHDGMFQRVINEKEKNNDERGKNIDGKQGIRTDVMCKKKKKEESNVVPIFLLVFFTLHYRPVQRSH